MEVDDAPISADAKDRMKAVGITHLTPVQERTLRAVIVDDLDVLVRAPTGSGKTLAYLLPIAHALARLPAEDLANPGRPDALGDAAWFDHLFKNQAARAVKAQRAITSLTDPYAGWAKIDERDFVVRERSPYKASFDLDELDTYQDFAEYVEQIAAATAAGQIAWPSLPS